MDYKRFAEIVVRDFSAFAGQPMLIVLGLLMLIMGEYELFWRFVAGLVLIDVVSLTIRAIKFKERPMKIIYSNLIEKLDASSFPSIHAARAVIMFILFSQFFANIYATMLFALVALGICHSRVYLKNHHLPDVIAGMAIGALVWYGVSIIPVTIFPF